MKKLMIIIAALAVAISASAQTAKTIYNKYSGKSNVSSVYISPAMFKLMGTIPEIEMGDEDIDISSVISSLDGMYILESENRQVSKALLEESEKLLGRGNYELLMEVNDEDENVKMYVRIEGEVIKSFLLFASEKYESDASLIMFDGAINRKDLQTLLSATNKKFGN